MPLLSKNVRATSAFNAKFTFCVKGPGLSIKPSVNARPRAGLILAANKHSGRLWGVGYRRRCDHAVEVGDQGLTLPYGISARRCIVEGALPPTEANFDPKCTALGVRFLWREQTGHPSHYCC